MAEFKVGQKVVTKLGNLRGLITGIVHDAHGPAAAVLFIAVRNPDTSVTVKTEMMPLTVLQSDEASEEN